MVPFPIFNYKCSGAYDSDLHHRQYVLSTAILVIYSYWADG